jgi:hypothetical protein
MEVTMSETSSGGVPATGAGALADMLAADPPPYRRSAAFDLLDQALSAPRHVAVQEWESWVEDGSFEGGHWVRVEG